MPLSSAWRNPLRGLPRPPGGESSPLKLGRHEQKGACARLAARPGPDGFAPEASGQARNLSVSRADDPPPAGGRSLSIMAILVSDPVNCLSGTQPTTVAVLWLFAIVPQQFLDRSTGRDGNGTGACPAPPSRCTDCPAGFAHHTPGAASAGGATHRLPSQGLAARGNPHPSGIGGHGKHAGPSKQGSRQNRCDANWTTPRRGIPLPGGGPSAIRRSISSLARR
jgi:hypothetical protein